MLRSGEVVCAVILILLAWAFSSIKSPAAAHDWYPTDCCHELVMQNGTVVRGDCGVADLITQTAEGTVVRQRATGITVTIPPEFPRRKNTEDGQYHICVSRGDGYETPPGHVYCFFEPAGSYRHGRHHL